MTTDATGVRAAAREHAVAVSALLSAVALALVFAVVLELVPGGSLPRPPEAALAAVPHVNAALSLTAIVTISLGVRFARRAEYGRHRVAMLASTVLFAAFLLLYLYRVAILGPTEFPGPATVEQLLYLPVLVIHVTLAVVCVPLVIYTLTLAATRPLSDLFDTRHARVGRIAASLWLISFTLGTVVYALLYHLY
ncbi:DUF420 domain-containing protein [Halorarum halophilum]|uniref:DUF420 domain-containing protein n=1 Tax=Halorarum halophilum TaxID=2743090 RepID=A0A7D5KTZ4_9EURY|nr:DUF420 domain-containing protein [Halobaculum halophilum]QLG26720.1 DUF420 domain-containing protein [Halobaculum halophilum]